jgi:hypothetical protein
MPELFTFVWMLVARLTLSGSLSDRARASFY